MLVSTSTLGDGFLASNLLLMPANAVFINVELLSWITLTQHRRYPFSDSTTFLFGNNPSLIRLFPGPQHPLDPQGHEHHLDLYSESMQTWIPHHFTTWVLIAVTWDSIWRGHDTIHMQPGFCALATRTPLCRWPYPMGHDYTPLCWWIFTPDIPAKATTLLNGDRGPLGTTCWLLYAHDSLVTPRCCGDNT
jgi:hypothetical protein